MITIEKEVCEICLQPITHPICTNCHIKHMEYWLEDLDTKVEKKEILETIKRVITKESLNETKCVICGGEEVSICSYCAFVRVSKFLENFGLNEKVLENFEDIFNHEVDQYPIPEE